MAILRSLEQFKSERGIDLVSDRGDTVHSFDSVDPLKRYLVNPNFAIESEIWVLQERVENHTKRVRFVDTSIEEKTTSASRVRYDRVVHSIRSTARNAPVERILYRVYMIGYVVIYTVETSRARRQELVGGTRILLNPEREIPIEKDTYDVFLERCGRLFRSNDIQVGSVGFEVGDSGIPIVRDIRIDADYCESAEVEARSRYADRSVPSGLDSLVTYLSQRIHSISYRNH